MVFSLKIVTFTEMLSVYRTYFFTLKGLVSKKNAISSVNHHIRTALSLFLCFSLSHSLMVEGARAVISPCMRSAIPEYMVVPPDMTLLCQSALTTMAGHGNIVPSRASKANYEVTCHMLKVSQIHSSLSLSTSVNSLKGLK